MRIGIIATENKTGIGRVFKKTTEKLVSIYNKDEFWLFQAENAVRRFEFEHCINVEYYSNSVPILGRSLRDRNIAKKAKKLGLDILHEMANGGIPMCRTECKTIQTIHDVVPFIYPEKVSQDVVRWYRWVIPKVLKKADAVIVVGDSVKKDIMRLFHTPTEKITVAENAPDERFKPNLDTSSVMTKLNLPERFVLFLGNIAPKRNIHNLIEAFAVAARELPELNLVLAGGYQKDSPYVRQLLNKIHRHNLDKRVLWLGYVDDECLPELYNAAEVFAYVPYYEGFCIPPLEAMACGTCVLATNNPPMLDVVGDAALIVDPDNVKDMADALTTLTTDEDARNFWRKRGLERAEKFTWENTARKVRSVYEKVLS